jgi:hypothetical protein
MHRLLLLAAIVAAAGVLVLPGTSAADTVGDCPPQFELRDWPYQGSNPDHNGDGKICRRALPDGAASPAIAIDNHFRG